MLRGTGGAFRRLRLAAAAGLLASGVGAASADVFHLRNGGTVEGELVRVAEDHYEIRTAAGFVRLPEASVLRVDESESPFREYERRNAAAEDTAAGQFELSEWCGANGLLGEQRKHLRRALTLERDFEPARRALGFVRVNGFWVEARTPVRPARTGSSAEDADDPEKLATAIRVQWVRRIRALRAAFLDGRDAQLFERGAEEVRAIRDPLAIVPLVELLGRGDLRQRRLLIEALRSFGQDEATLNLAVIALLDPAEEVRDAAVAELVRRNDPRITGQFRAALRSGNETLIRRGAEALGALRASEAIPDLIDLLRARQQRLVDVPVPVYLGVLRNTFNSPTVVDFGQGLRIVHGPIIPSGSFTDQIENIRRPQVVTVLRTEVLEALKTITGENFGFDALRWAQWFQEQQP